MRAGWTVREIVFAARGEGPFLLAFGNARTQPNALSIETLVPGWGGKAAPPIGRATTGAVQTLKDRAQHTFKIEIECESLDMVKEALGAGADIIMLDNMTMDEMREAIRFIDRRVPVEVSGGIREHNIVEMARLGPDVISVGDLTRNVQTVDVSLDVGEIKSSALRQIRTGQDH